MPHCIKNPLRAILLVFAVLSCFPAMATHLAGSDFTYVFIDSSAGNYHYRVKLELYEDCLGGTPSVIAQDNPAFFGVYNSSGTLVHVDSVSFSSSVAVPTTSYGPCGSGGVPLCLLRKTFIKDYYLPASTGGYTVTYQRCCKNNALTNVDAPGDHGSTYFCKIPPIGSAHYNNSAVFSAYPPLVLAVNTAFVIDQSATDADGDSISYELCAPYEGATASDVKPWPPAPPPYSVVTYSSPYTSVNPMSCSAAMTIDPITGILTGTPNLLGRYLIAICCHEWRAGVMINTVRREFEFSVQTLSTSTFHPYAGHDTAIYVGDTIQFMASHGSAYLWSPGTYLTSTTIQDPVGHFPDPGLFPYVLREVSDSGCVGYDTVVVNVLMESGFMIPSGFTPNGDGKNDYLLPISVKNSKLVNFKVYNRNSQLLFTSTSPNDGWDGTFKGKHQDIGTYFIEVFYLDNNGKLRSTRGSAALVK